MAIGPIDYMGMIPQVDIAQSLGQGLQLGAAIKAQQEKNAQMELAKQQQELYKADLQNALSNPTAQNWAAMSAKYPQQREAFKQSWDMLSKEQQDQDYLSGAKAFNAISSGNINSARAELDKRIAAMENSGQDTSRLKAMRSTLDTNPNLVQGQLGLVLSSIDGDRFKKMAEAPTLQEGAQLGLEKTRTDIGKARADTEKARIEAQFAPAKAQADISNINSQISERAARLGLDQDKLTSEYQYKMYELGQKEGKLEGDSRKLVNDAVQSAIVADQSAGQALNLATRLEQAGGGYGRFSGASDWIKNATGNQNAMTEMRREYTRLRNTSAIKYLPAGPASDKDVAMAMEGFPPPNADSATLASFLKGVAKLQQYEAANQNAQAEWVNAVGHLGKPKGDIEVSGIRVPAGSSFSDFSKQFIQKQADERGAQQAVQQAQGRSYMRYAQPQTAPSGATGGY